MLAVMFSKTMKTLKTLKDWYTPMIADVCDGCLVGVVGVVLRVVSGGSDFVGQGFVGDDCGGREVL